MKKCLEKKNKHSCFIYNMQHRIVIPQTPPRVHNHMGHTQPDHEINKSRSKPRLQDAYIHYRAFLLRPIYTSTLGRWNIRIYIYFKYWWHPRNPVKGIEETCYKREHAYKQELNTLAVTRGRKLYYPVLGNERTLPTFINSLDEREMTYTVAEQHLNYKHVIEFFN